MGGKGADGLLVGKAHFVLIHFGSAAVMSS